MNTKLKKHIDQVKSVYVRQGRTPLSAQDIVGGMGYDAAEKMGALEEYMDALGPNFRRSRTAWAEKWAAIYG